VWQLVAATYVLTVAALTALTARRKGRETLIWFVGGLPLLLLALIAPHAGRPWRSRAFLAIGLFGLIALAIVLLIVAISEAHFA
jgi:hypothetical protein